MLGMFSFGLDFPVKTMRQRFQNMTRTGITSFLMTRGALMAKKVLLQAVLLA